MSIFYIRDNSLHFKEEEDKVLILQKDKKSVVELNEIGLVIWKLLKSKKTVDNLVQKILQKYNGVEYDDVKNDVEEFVLRCEKDSIIKKVSM